MTKVVKKAQNSPKIILKKESAEDSKRVDSQRPITNLEQMGDANFGTLDSSKHKSVVVYDSIIDKFILMSADEMLSTSAEDQNLPDDFISQVESELDLGNIQLDNLDGGSFQ
jgi:hypothetical protein